MNWDEDLAKKAQAYADILMNKTLNNCGVLSDDIWVHDPRNKEQGVGENLYWGDGKDDKNITTMCGLADRAW